MSRQKKKGKRPPQDPLAVLHGGPAKTVDGRLQYSDGTLRAVRGADGRREQPPIFSAPRLPATARGWAADTISGAPRPYTRRQIVDLRQLGIDVEGYPAHLVDGIYRMFDQPVVVDAAQRMSELVADTNDDFEDETVPADPDREAAFAEMIAAAEREIAAEKAESRPFGVVDENYWHDEPAIGAKRRFSTWRGKGSYPTAVRRIKARGKKKGLVVVEYGPTASAVFKRHGRRDQASVRRAAEDVFKRHGTRFEALSEEFKTRRGRPRIHADDAEKMRAYRRRKKED
jgi:hypothetical protein